MSFNSVSKNGFTMIEILVTIFIIGTVVVGLFGLFILNLRLSQEGERRVAALALMNERAEMVRNLPYEDVGTVNGIPPGAILQSETVLRNNATFTIQTDIRYIDDPFDGTVSTNNPQDLVNTDYKQVRIEVSWNSQTRIEPIVVILQVSPQGIEEGDTAGTLVFGALNAQGQGVAGASVQLVNTTTNPTINVTTQTDSSGQVVLPGLPQSSDSYELTVSKSGFTTEQTYDVAANFIPNADHRHLSSLPGQITPKTFSIDQVSRLSIETKDPLDVAIGSVAYHIQGTKSHGTDSASAPVYIVDQDSQTNVSGTSMHTNLVWDTYTLSINGQTTGYDIKETSLVLPVVVNPAADLTLEVTLVPYNPQSLHVTVVQSDGTPIDNATVRLFGTGYDQTQGTGTVGQVYFPDTSVLPLVPIPSNGDYTLEVSAPGFDPSTQTVTVTNTTSQTVTLVPS